MTMTHTKKSEPKFIKLKSGLDVQPVLDLIDAKPEIWHEITARQNSTASAHTDTECVFARGPLKMSQYYVQFDLGAYDYPVLDYLGEELTKLMRPLFEEMYVKELGRVLIVKLKPGGHVKPHNDQGTYSDYYSRFHVVLSSNDLCSQTCGDDHAEFDVGDVWWFDHKEIHTADNKGETDRVHIIFDAVTPLFDKKGVPISSTLESKVKQNEVRHGGN